MTDPNKTSSETIDAAIQARLDEIRTQAQTRKLRQVSADNESMDRLSMPKRFSLWLIPLAILIVCVMLGSGFYYWDAYHFAYHQRNNDLEISHVMQDWIASVNEKNYDDFSPLNCLAMRDSAKFDNPLTFDKEVTQGRQKFGSIKFLNVQDIFTQGPQAQANLAIRYPQLKSHERVIRIQLMQEFGQWKSCSITPHDLYPARGSSFENIVH